MYFCAINKNDETWEWCGISKQEAIEMGLDLWDDGFLEGFYIAPSHKSLSEDDSDQEYTIEVDKAEYIPIKLENNEYSEQDEYGDKN